jgi:hypothetical protein
VAVAGEGANGTHSCWPEKIWVLFPRQFAAWSWLTLTPKTRLRLDKVSPGRTV